MILADSDVLIDALRGREPNEAASRAVATARRELEGRGETIGMSDYLIAGVCLARPLPLLTRNRAHFDRIPGLILVDP